MAFVTTLREVSSVLAMLDMMGMVSVVMVSALAMAIAMANCMSTPNRSTA